MLEIKSLTHKYGNFTALNNVSLTVENGDFIGLIGPNGAGKTTLMNALTGILSSAEGEILVDGKSVSGFNPEVRRKIGYMPSELSTYEIFSPFELLTFLSAMYDLSENEMKDRMQTLFSKLEMNEWKNKSIKKLSTGMKKKTAFAAAILHMPKFLVLDEPFESVDPISQHNMKSILNDFLKNGNAIIMSSHVLDTVENLCNKFVILNKGEIIKKANIKDIETGSLEDEFFDIVKQLNLDEDTCGGEDDVQED